MLSRSAISVPCFMILMYVHAKNGDTDNLNMFVQKTVLEELNIFINAQKCYIIKAKKLLKEKNIANLLHNIARLNTYYANHHKSQSLYHMQIMRLCSIATYIERENFSLKQSDLDIFHDTKVEKLRETSNERFFSL